MTAGAGSPPCLQTHIHYSKSPPVSYPESSAGSRDPRIPVPCASRIPYPLDISPAAQHGRPQVLYPLPPLHLPPPPTIQLMQSSISRGTSPELRACKLLRAPECVSPGARRVGLAGSGVNVVVHAGILDTRDARKISNPDNQTSISAWRTPGTRSLSGNQPPKQGQCRRAVRGLQTRPEILIARRFRPPSFFPFRCG